MLIVSTKELCLLRQTIRVSIKYYMAKLCCLATTEFGLVDYNTFLYSLTEETSRYCHCKVSVYLPIMKQSTSLGVLQMREDHL